MLGFKKINASILFEHTAKLNQTNKDDSFS